MMTGGEYFYNSFVDILSHKVVNNLGRGHFSDRWIAADVTTSVCLLSVSVTSPQLIRLAAHFRLSGSDARARWRWPAPPTLGFENALQKPTGDVTDTTPIFFHTVNG